MKIFTKDQAPRSTNVGALSQAKFPNIEDNGSSGSESHSGWLWKQEMEGCCPEGGIAHLADVCNSNTYIGFTR